MTRQHCPGCEGYTRHGNVSCMGVTAAAGDFIVPDIVPPLGLWDRIRVLFGRPVLMGVTAGPVSEPLTLPLGWADEWPGEGNGFKS
jgi:hypothetical protein